MPKRKILPNGDPWNSASWESARKRAIQSKDPFCAICQNFVDISLPRKDSKGKWNPLACEVDHIIPVSRGGQPYEVENLQLTHMRCNRKKGAKMDSDYKGLESGNPVPLSNPW